MAAKVVTIREDDGFNLPPLGVEDGTTFGFFDRWNVGTTPDGKYLTDYSDWEARDLHEMLTKDYRAQQIEKVLSLPIISASYTIQPAPGDSGEAKWLNDYWAADPFAGGCHTSLDAIISLMTSAIYYKRAYFEKVWAKGTGPFAGKLVYDDVAWRPQTTCRIMRDPKNGRFKGFEQEAYFVGPQVKSAGKWPIQIPPERAFVYTHGVRKDPLNGSSDMEVAYWAWKTKQKILMLWFQFLQSVSLPRITVKANDTTTATQVAQEISRMKASGVLPLAVPGGPQSVGIDVLDVSGKGAEQFLQAINWLDTAATDSVLAGFLNLTGSANMSHFGGSYALSKDASDFFLQTVESKAREMEDQIRRGLFAPLIRHNFGPNAAVPLMKFEPLNDIDKESAIELLKQAMAAPPGGPVPTSFISDLAGQVATYLGLDGEAARSAFKDSFDAAAAQAQAKALTDSGGVGPAATPTGQAVAGLAGAVNAAHQAIKSGADPTKAAAQAQKAHSTDQKIAGVQAKAHAAKQALLTKHAKNAVKAKTGGDVALSNDDTDLAGFNPAEPRVGGMWTAGAAAGAQAKQPPAKQPPAQPPAKGAKQGAQTSQAALLKEKAQLTAEAAHLRAEIARAKAGVHHGAAGVHKGPAGTKASSSKKAVTHTKSGSSVGSKGGKGPSLAQQVAALKVEVHHLRQELAAIKHPPVTSRAVPPHNSHPAPPPPQGPGGKPQTPGTKGTK